MWRSVNVESETHSLWGLFVVQHRSGHLGCELLAQQQYLDSAKGDREVVALLVVNDYPKIARARPGRRYGEPETATGAQIALIQYVLEFSFGLGGDGEHSFFQPDDPPADQRVW